MDIKIFIAMFFEWLGKIGMDKYQHFTFGALIACISALIVCWLPLWAIVIISTLCTALVALGKEWYDDIVDWWDFGFTMFGGLTVWIALVL